MSSTTFRRLAALAAFAFALPFAAVAVAQQPTDTLGDYTQTVQPETIQTQDTQETLPSEEEGQGEQEEAGEEETGTTPGAAPSAPSAPGSTPPALAFTGFEAALVAGFGLLLIGAAVALQRRRRAS